MNARAEPFYGLFIMGMDCVLPAIHFVTTRGDGAVTKFKKTLSVDFMLVPNCFEFRSIFLVETNQARRYIRDEKSLHASP